MAGQFQATINKANLEGTRNLIAATKDYAPNARFIMASTGLVYGDGTRPVLKAILSSQSATIRPAKLQPKTCCVKAA